ncbi:MAG: TylF/MycF/NovP-related O-methyltransferase [Candidatus Eiseniibacteriota bacterium]
MSPLSTMKHRLAERYYYPAMLTRLARAVRRQNLTYLSLAKLMTLERMLDRVKRRRVPGDFLECGVALGGSAILIAGKLDGARAFHGYDVFGMIPPPGTGDGADAHDRYAVIAAGKSNGIGGERYYGYRDDLLNEVKGSFDRFGLSVDQRRIALHKGVFADTIRLAPKARVAFAHIDCDWYDPVRLCLERIAPHMPRGGVFVLDDFNDYGGCRRAATEFLGRAPDFALESVANSAVIARR